MNSRVQVIFFILTFQILKSSQFPTIEATCKTHDNKFGSCVEITKCQTIKNYLSTVENESTENKIKVLKSYICGSIGEEPKMCCPEEPIAVNLADNEIFPNSLYPTSNQVFHKNLKLLPKDCGKSSKIRGTTSLSEESLRQSVNNSVEATVNEFPWMVLLSNSIDNKRNNFRCVGTIINERYILTTAFCIGEQLVSARVGAHNISSSEACKKENNTMKCSLPTQDIAIEKQIRHTNFSVSTSCNDIALLRLAKPLDLSSENVKAICLPLQSSPNSTMASHTNFMLIGWGLSKKGFNNEVLLKAEVSTITRKQCSQSYKKHLQDLILSNQQFCFGGEWNAGNDSCNSDTGSPIQMLNGMRYTQYGIVSKGSRYCGNTTFPTVNTRIDQYIDWILNNIEQ